MLAINAFRPSEDFLADSAILHQKIKETPPAPGIDEVLLPGEPEHRAAQQRQAEGISIDETTWTQLIEAATGLDVAIPDGLA